MLDVRFGDRVVTSKRSHRTVVVARSTTGPVLYFTGVVRGLTSLKDTQGCTQRTLPSQSPGLPHAVAPGLFFLWCSN
jgi:hypothetical protein